MAENDDEKKLSPKQILALGHLSTGGRIAGAAKAAGVSETTISRWLRQPVFSAELRRLEGFALRSLGRRLLGLGDLAGRTLQEALQPGERMGHRLRAADMVTARAPALLELTGLIERLEALESRFDVEEPEESE